MNRLSYLLSALVLTSYISLASDNMPTHFVYPDKNLVMKYDDKNQFVGAKTHREKKIIFKRLYKEEETSFDYGETWDKVGNSVASKIKSFAFALNEKIVIPKCHNRALVQVSVIEESALRQIPTSYRIESGCIVLPDIFYKGTYLVSITYENHIELSRFLIY